MQAVPLMTRFVVEMLPTTSAECQQVRDLHMLSHPMHVFMHVFTDSSDGCG